MPRTVIAVLAGTALLLPAAARADTVAIAGPGGPTMVAAKKGWTAWSERPRGTTMWTLVLRAPNGTLSRPAVAQRTVPFDVDLGVDARGDVVATYSRCAREPVPVGGANPHAGGGLPQYATGERCSIRVLDPITARERTIGRASGDRSEVLPSMAGRKLAYVGVRTSSRAALVVRDLRSRAARAVFAGSLGRGIGPLSVDTDGRFVTAAWRSRHGTGLRTGLLLGRVTGTARPAAAVTDRAGSAFAALVGAGLSGGRAGFLTTPGRGFCERRTSGGSATYGVGDASTSSPVSAVVDGNRLVVGEVQADDSHPLEPTTNGQILVFDTGRYGSSKPSDGRC